MSTYNIESYRSEKTNECPIATQNLEVNTRNRNSAIQADYIQYGPLNLSDAKFYLDLAHFWRTSVNVAKQSNCMNCAAFDISPSMLDCMPGPLSEPIQDQEGYLGYCWMHHFKCHSARTCRTWAAGGPISENKISLQWKSRSSLGATSGASLGTPDFLSLYKQGFPEVPIEIAGRRTKAYNCIARSIGVTDRWVWNEVDLNENGEASFSEFVRFYDMHGYQPTSDESKAVIALYGVRQGVFIAVKHAARKVNGQWESKMGQGDTIRHHEADIFGGTSYGDLMLYFEQYMDDPIDPRKRITTF